MHLEGTLAVTVAQRSSAGAKPENEDCMGIRIPEDPLLTLKGVAAVIADGVSAAEAGKEASETCVQSFLSDYFNTPDAWTVKTSSQKILTALNRWLYGQGQRFIDAHRGYISTLSILVLKSRTAHLFHVGDTRIHLLREGQLEQLTTDHATPISESQTYLTRAMGMDIHLDVDYRKVEIEPGDLFFLSTDGIHDHLPAKRIASLLGEAKDYEATCDQLIAEALDAGSTDNLTCQILRVDALPDQSSSDLYSKLTELPFPPALEPGMILDGYRIERELHSSNRSQIYLVTDIATDKRLVMKTPSVNFDDDPAYIERFIMEQWIGRRVSHANVVRVVESVRRPTCLYYLTEYIEGITLGQWIRQNPQPEVRVVVDFIKQIAAGLRAFHRKETLHQDLKPDNVIIDRNGVAILIDFGSCFVAGIDEIAAPIQRDLVLGTADYSAPEVHLGQSHGISSDLYSLGCIAYEMLTGHLPYGLQDEGAPSRDKLAKLQYTPSYHHNPMIPVWLDGALKKAVQLTPERRYEIPSAFIFDLEHPNPRFAANTALPFIERDPLRFWRGLALMLTISQLLTLWYFLSR